VLEQIVADSGLKIITNNGKTLAKAVIAAGLPDREIFDVVLAEKLVLNGEVELRSINLQSILKRQGYEVGERSLTVRRLYDVWIKQEEEVGKLGLIEVRELEQRILWVTAKIEMAGIAMDVDGLLHYRETILARLNVPDGATDMRLTAELECIESYLSLIGDDDRIRDSIDQLNTRTGRFYPLVQTFKKDGPLRSFFRARQGYKLIVADYSQQEARIIAALSGDRAAIGIFKAGKDIYLEVAAALLGRPPVQCQNYRKLAKEIVLGLNNGRSAYSICDQLEKMGFHYDVDDIHGFILRYNILFDGIKRWREDIAESGKCAGMLATRLGRVLKVASNANENSLCNFPVQATAADGFKRALVLIDERLRGMDAQVVHILHDEVIVEAREDIAEWVALTVKESMEEGFKNLLPEVSFGVEPAIRDTWKVSQE
jgi:DNA polymerase I-like protein with 3'-5' exonuclease and polymerase domains